MPFYLFIWDEENEDHVAQHGVSREEFEAIVRAPDSTKRSRSTNRPMACGYAPDGRYLACVYELIDDLYVYPITAFEME